MTDPENQGFGSIHRPSGPIAQKPFLAAESFKNGFLQTRNVTLPFRSEKVGFRPYLAAFLVRTPPFRPPI
ncbi:MAG TPA: hypothetical protein PK971_13310, partial [Saprospiraceae bacterium]|nr:hypothetical protein [Saprospiraceae bacterium]